MVTVDTNIAFYALTENAKAEVASQALEKCDFLSIQVLNEYANSNLRKRLRKPDELAQDLSDLTDAVPVVAPIGLTDHREAMRLVTRYRISFYDALMIAVALAQGATVLYSEDMHDGLVIDGVLTIVNPFRTAEPA